MERNELGHWLRLSATPEVGNGTARRLLTAFGTPAAVFGQDKATLRQVAGEAQVRALLTPPHTLAALVESTWAWLQASAQGQAERRVLTLGNPAYPGSLLRMEDPPLLLHAMGRWDAWQHFVAEPDAPRGLAIVGSRNPTPQGLLNARRFAAGCTETGWTVVSGLARGIDGAAHEGALAGAHGQPGLLATVAVVGTGLDSVYPRAHLALAHGIAAQGMLLSEYPLGTPPLAANFPRRNRLIAGLARGTLVVEAALRSGSLITARLAVEQGKEVFAIPGSIHAPQSQGCHALIQQGAKLAASLQDVFDEFSAEPALRPAGAVATNAPAEAALSEGDAALLAHISLDPIGLDALMARTGLPTARLQARLLELELEGRVARLPGGLYQRLVTG